HPAATSRPGRTDRRSRGRLPQLVVCRRSSIRNRIQRRSHSRLANRPSDVQGTGGDGVTVIQVQKPNLTDEEIRYAVKKLGREPNEVEWAMLEAQWSEHCSYKSSTPLLTLLP